MAAAGVVAVMVQVKGRNDTSFLAIVRMHIQAASTSEWPATPIRPPFGWGLPPVLSSSWRGIYTPAFMASFKGSLSDDARHLFALPGPPYLPPSPASECTASPEVQSTARMDGLFAAERELPTHRPHLHLRIVLVVGPFVHNKSERKGGGPMRKATGHRPRKDRPPLYEVRGKGSGHG